MRIYIIVTCFEPLKAYIFQEGLVRLATQPYSTAKGSLKKRFIHLTNFSINKKAENYKKNTEGLGKKGEEVAANVKEGEDKDEEQMSSKWSLQQLRKEYEKMGINYDEVYKNIKNLCIKTLMAVEPQITTAMRATKYRTQCFEIYGFDVIIDAKLRPWLLEVNVAPSLSSSSPYDKQVKTMLLCDTLHLAGYRIFDRKKVEDDRKKESKHRLLGFESMKKTMRREKEMTDEREPEEKIQTQKSQLALSPTKMKSQQEPSSPEKAEKTKNQPHEKKEKATIPSFLDGFNALSEDDLEILAEFEEEQRRKGHFELLFPTRQTIEAYGPYFESQRHANLVLWQYIR